MSCSHRPVYVIKLMIVLYTFMALLAGPLVCVCVCVCNLWMLCVRVFCGCACVHVFCGWMGVHVFCGCACVSVLCGWACSVDVRVYVLFGWACVPVL